MDRRHSSRGYSNGDYDAPRSSRRRSSYDSERRPSRTEFIADDVFRTIRITNLNPRVSDKEVMDVVYREFRNFGDYNVKVTYYGDQRIAFVNFQYAEDAAAALSEFYNHLVLFDIPVRLGPVYPKPPPRGPYIDRHDPPPRNFSPGRRSYPEPDFGRKDMYGRGDFDDRLPPPPRDNIINRIRHLEPEDDGYATRTLFVGNVNPDISNEELKDVFARYGHVEDVDIKKPAPGAGNPYAFVRYFNLNMAHMAKVKLSGQFIGPYQCKIGYGKPAPTSCVWVGNVGPWITKSGLGREFDRFGSVQRVVWPEGRDFAYIVYNNVESAKDAVQRMRGFQLKGAKKRLRTDFVDPKHPESELNFKSYRSGSYSSVDRRSRNRRLTNSRSLSRSVSRSSDRNSRSPFSPGLIKMKRKKHRSKESRHSKRHRVDDDDRRSSGKTVSRSAKKHKRSASLSSNASFRSEMSQRGYQSDGRNVSLLNDNGLGELKSVVDMSRYLPVVWSGTLSLKNSAFFVRLHLVLGNPTLTETLMSDTETGKFSSLKLTQRLRMDQSKLDEVRRRIALSGKDWSVLLALTDSAGGENLEAGMQERPLKNLVSYLRQKEAAGVLSLPPNCAHGQESGLLHTFAPCEFAHEYLKQRAPNVELDMSDEDYIVVILVRVNV